MATSTTSTAQSMATIIAAKMSIVGLVALLKFFGFLVSLGVLFGLFSGLSFVTTAIIMQLNHRFMQPEDTTKKIWRVRADLGVAMTLGAFSGVIALFLTIAIGVSVGPEDPSLWELETIILAGSAVVALIHLACVVMVAVGSIVVWTYRRSSGDRYSEFSGEKLEQGVEMALVNAEE
ncbi:hypothetical protein LTS10_005714 [Elasticomyces elasticus]|nr:hypothetical protein LTS10_005714 [Elasticomyces elasticus]